MLHRRHFLKQALQGSSLLAIGSVVPEFIVNTARAAEAGKERVLVVVEMTGGNDGLNTVIPYADDLYHKARPKLHYTKDEVVRINDHVGLHPSLRQFGDMLQKGELAVVQGVGYPNPNRSHFESMDVWQSGDPRRRLGTGWIARSAAELQARSNGFAAVHLGPRELPLALQGAAGGIVSLGTLRSYLSEPNAKDPNLKARKRLMEDLTKSTDAGKKDSLLAFVQRRQLQTYATMDRLAELFRVTAPAASAKAPVVLPSPVPEPGIPGENELASPKNLSPKLNVIAQLIAKGLSARVFYVSLDGFDTHSGQKQEHATLLAELSSSIAAFFEQLKQTGNDKRVLLLTFSEFGRRVQENGSGGTDHGAASCLFIAGSSVKAGVVGSHPSLKDLDSGDLKHHTDFRRV
ncbi:MAG TPA: DUF1501 domain-containing protein, partial [Gemmataceae bacterium]|nr:DUF1501 domain-containing protein [Gemmataceae bacterium]